MTVLQHYAKFIKYYAILVLGTCLLLWGIDYQFEILHVIGIYLIIYFPALVPTLYLQAQFSKKHWANPVRIDSTNGKLTQLKSEPKTVDFNEIVNSKLTLSKSHKDFRGGFDQMFTPWTSFMYATLTLESGESIIVTSQEAKLDKIQLPNLEKEYKFLPILKNGR